MRLVHAQLSSRAALGQGNSESVHRGNAICGGWISTNTQQLAVVWWARRSGLLRTVDVRAWLALLEVQHRRRAARLRSVAQNVDSNLFAAELSRLLGQPCPDLGPLLRLGAIRFDDRAPAGFRLARHPRDLAISTGAAAELEDFLGQAPRRRVGLPRRLLRAAVRYDRRAVLGTLLAHLVRCTGFREGAPTYLGRCSASFAVSWAGLSIRAARAARAELARDGILRLPARGSWHGEQGARRGRLVEIAVTVKRSPQESHRPQRPHQPHWAPSTAFSTGYPQKLDTRGWEPSVPSDVPPVLHPHRETLTSPTEMQKDQIRARARAPGFSTPGPEDRPRIGNVGGVDLASVPRLEELLDQARRRGWAPTGERGRLEWFSLAEHAMAHGREPARLFAWLFRNQRFDRITEAEESAAQRRLKAWDRQQPVRLIPGIELGRVATRVNDAIGWRGPYWEFR